MSEGQVQLYFQRIDKLNAGQHPLFGKMNANQMICHCTDQIRLAMGTKKSTEYGQVDPNQIILLSKSGKVVPTPKGLGQVEGDGTQPTNLEDDKEILKQHILTFSKLDNNFNCAPHPYFGEIDKKRWKELIVSP